SPAHPTEGCDEKSSRRTRRSLELGGHEHRPRSQHDISRQSQFAEALVMTLLRTIGLLCLSLLLFVGRAQAGLIFHADLTTGAEAGANSFADQVNRGAPTTGPGLGLGPSRPLSFGTANFFLNDAGTALSFTATVSNIDFTGSQTPGPNDDLVAAHIHAGGAAAATFPVVWGFFGSPFNDLNSPGFFLSPQSDCTAFATGVGGTCAGTWDLGEGNSTTLAA